MFEDLDRLTVFADNLSRTDGVLVYAPELAEAIDAERPLPAGGELERELRACAVHACEALGGSSSTDTSSVLTPPPVVPYVHG